MTDGRRDQGTGLVATIAGVSVFLVFLLFAVQLIIGLYATSAVTSAAFDGARQVAGHRVDHSRPDAVAAAQRSAEQRMRGELGRYGQQVTFDWSGSDASTVVLRVQAPAPRVGLPGVGQLASLSHIDRLVRVRIEELR